MAPKRLLHVEDQPDHAFLVGRALERLNANCALVHVQDGEEALAYLRGPAPTPDLILLDLRLPRMDGLTLLQTVKGDPELRHIPVVILTTSAAEADRRLAGARHANSYLVKPVEPGALKELLAQVDAYWLCQDQLVSPLAGTP